MNTRRGLPARTATAKIIDVLFDIGTASLKSEVYNFNSEICFEGLDANELNAMVDADELPFEKFKIVMIGYHHLTEYRCEVDKQLIDELEALCPEMPRVRREQTRQHTPSASTITGNGPDHIGEPSTPDTNEPPNEQQNETNPTATDGENVRHGDIDPTPEASINQSMMRHISLGNTHHKPTPALPETPNIPSIHPQSTIYDPPIANTNLPDESNIDNDFSVQNEPMPNNPANVSNNQFSMNDIIGILGEIGIDGSLMLDLEPPQPRPREEIEFETQALPFPKRIRSQSPGRDNGQQTKFPRINREFRELLTIQQRTGDETEIPPRNDVIIRTNDDVPLPDMEPAVQPTDAEVPQPEDGSMAMDDEIIIPPNNDLIIRTNDDVPLPDMEQPVQPTDAEVPQPEDGAMAEPETLLSPQLRTVTDPVPPSTQQDNRRFHRRLIYRYRKNNQQQAEHRDIPLPRHKSLMPDNMLPEIRAHFNTIFGACDKNNIPLKEFMHDNEDTQGGRLSRMRHACALVEMITAGIVKLNDDDTITVIALTEEESSASELNESDDELL